MKFLVENFSEFLNNSCESLLLEIDNFKTSSRNKAKFTNLIHNLNSSLSAKLQEIQIEREVAKVANNVYISGQNISNIHNAKEIVNSIVNYNKSEADRIQIDDFITNVQEMKHKSNDKKFFKISFKPKVHKKICIEGKELSMTQLLFKNLKYASKIRDQFGSFFLEKEIPHVLKEDYDVLKRHDRNIKKIHMRDSKQEGNNRTTLHSKIYYSFIEKKLVLAKRYRLNDLTYTQWEVFGVKDLYPSPELEPVRKVIHTVVI